MMQTAVLEGLVKAAKGFSCFLLRGVGCRTCSCYMGPFRASLAHCRVSDLILQLAVGLLVTKPEEKVDFCR
jgi:hypothetical protein